MHTKHGVIARIEEDKAVVHFDDGQILNWEADNLPRDCAKDSEVVLEIKSKSQAGKQELELAQKILYEIFNPAQSAQQHIS